jgi:hypothetical protein
MTVVKSQDAPTERLPQLFGAASVLRIAAGTSLALAEQAEYDRELTATRAQLAAAGFEAAWAEGQAMTPEQALACALEKLHG